ncbi:hypothetical protein [Pararhodobacter zhoushanensis]|uniref:DUF4258 domain-containing protein n=1 Tax=Pararhodobacter zhoushanensis TaxID=2479545 RepID=A0ABT3H2U3_9RHOB|nr:hypothetical protein [Pararhodobacter zhoushanensis]MCW1934101.1 hypothetical protein [Pararhodobacter zhoushanensis]
MKHARPHVTDHAVLRYLERALKLDIETHRRKIGALVESAAAQGATGVIIDGMRYCLIRDANGAVVVTVREASTHAIKPGRKPRRRDGTA